MSKLTKEQLNTFAKAYVSDQIAKGTYNPSFNNVLNLLDKVGKQITITNTYSDKLPELDGEELLGRTVEEYFVALPTIVDGPKNRDLTEEDEKAYAEGALRPYLPDVGEVCYSYTLGRKIIPLTIPGNNVERAAISAENAADFITNITERLTASESVYKYTAKKELLKKLAAAAHDKGLVATVNVKAGETNVSESDKFIMAVKQAVEDASFAGEGNCLSGEFIGATDESNLMLVIRKGLIPNLDITTWAGAINLDKASFPNITIKVVDDFGSDDDGSVKAMLIDKRGVRLHKTYASIKSQENAYYDSVNLFAHSEYTAFYSKYTFVRVFEG